MTDKDALEQGVVSLADYDTVVRSRKESEMRLDECRRCYEQLLTTFIKTIVAGLETHDVVDVIIEIIKKGNNERDY